MWSSFLRMYVYHSIICVCRLLCLKPVGSCRSFPLDYCKVFPKSWCSSVVQFFFYYNFVNENVMMLPCTSSPAVVCCQPTASAGGGGWKGESRINIMVAYIPTWTKPRLSPASFIYARKIKAKRFFTKKS